MRAFDGTRAKARRRWAATDAVAVPCASGSWVTVSGFDTAFPGFSTTEIQGSGLWSYSTLITALVDCWIDVSLYVEMANSATGRRGARIAMDGVDSGGVGQGNFQSAVSAGPMRLGARYTGPLAATHTLTPQVFQDSGASLNLTWRQLTIKATAL